jgi:aminopeptidase-like protein
MTKTQTLTDRRERMKSLIDDACPLARDLVSDGMDQALERLGRDLPVNIHRYPSGSEAFTWIVPPKWTCHEAYLETMQGEKVFSYTDHVLHVASYSEPFEGVVSREELFKHLKTHDLPNAIPFDWKYYKKDWGLCCSQDQKAKLTDDEYRVVIKATKEPGELKIGEVVAEGDSGEEIVLCAHLCHPGQMNDDFSGVVVGMEVMRRLLELPRRRYTYRLLITPETIGSLAWLSTNEDKIGRIKSGMFLEMLGLEAPHALQTSLPADTQFDRLLWSSLREKDDKAWQGAFRTVIGNDERQFNAPGIRVPMLSLSRVFHPDSGKWPFPEYHSDLDNPSLASMEKLEDSIDTTFHMLTRLEENRYPVNLFKAEVFCSRYDLHVDFYSDREGNRQLFDSMQLIDGSRTVLEIAEQAQVPFAKVAELCRELEKHELVRMSSRPEPTDPHR